MATLITTRARARVNHGRWIADCPRPYCANAMRLQPGEAAFHCGGEGGCKLVAEVEWPADAVGIWAALEERPVPGTRNWYPDAHAEAVQLGLPHGQTATELRDETRQYEAGQVV
ncbi:hypothetical protein P1S61_21525 [Streptomyces sp. ME08-AFT2]|uniref:hypothetical protein n=1 Tax=Streptomyces sp. ME08-AFT2 TaxID=3028683 RepID=UPI0029A1D4C8|nr:hypothetical protein [Streptomyces sp. ME08-AFT2]MDX3311595.1 hypothetical protein [Streptomyces sp. ME08-AFT2]